MLDMGFIPDIERIVKMVPFTRQTLFFSATMPPEIERLADMFLHNPQRVEVARPSSTATTITQRLVATASEDHAKRDRLRQLIRGEDGLTNGIIFCNRKRDVAILQKSLVSHGFDAAALHGDMDQRARMAALDGFRNGETKLLVASDVAARGLDIPAVSHVFNFDVPRHPEDYVHRIGRTGRAGRLGAAFTLVTPDDDRSLGAIETLIGQPIPWFDGDLSSLSTTESEPRTRHRGRSADGRRGRSGGKSSGETRERNAPRAPRAETSSRTEAAPQPKPEQQSRKEAPRRQNPRAERGPEHDEDTPVGLGSHVPAFLLRPAIAKRDR